MRDVAGEAGCKRGVRRFRGRAIAFSFRVCDWRVSAAGISAGTVPARTSTVAVGTLDDRRYCSEDDRSVSIITIDIVFSREARQQPPTLSAAIVQ